MEQIISKKGISKKMTLKLDKEYLSEACGLSCIENYLIYILRAKGFPYQYLFGESVKAFSDIVNYFVREKVSYADYYDIARLHTAAQNHGFVRIYNTENLDIGTADRFSCIMVSEAFINEKYKTKLMRPDHYILLSNSSGDMEDVYYINDTPRDIGSISFKALTEIFAGHTISFEIAGLPQENQKNEMVESFIDSLNNLKENELNIVDSVSAARDIVGVLRVLRRRTCYFCSLFCDVGFMSEYISYLDKIYMNIEYMRLRGKNDMSEINEMLNQINHRDMQIVENIRKAVLRV